MVGICRHTKGWSRFGRETEMDTDIAAVWYVSVCGNLCVYCPVCSSSRNFGVTRRHTRGLSRFGKEAKADTLGTLASADMDLPSRAGSEHQVQVMPRIWKLCRFR